MSDKRCAFNLATCAQRAFRECLQLRDVELDRALPVVNENGNAQFTHAGGRVSAWKFRVIRRAPLLKLM